MRQYKYRTTSKYSIEGLINNQVFFSGFEQFNDPFEFSNPMIDLSIYNQRAREELNRLYSDGMFSKADYLHLLNAVKEPDQQMRESRLDLMNKISNGLHDFGVFCLSEVNDNILMWSHYGEEHKGFCIEFEDLESHLETESSLIPVNYIEEFQDLNDPAPLISLYVEMFSNFKGLDEESWKRKSESLAKEVISKEERDLGIAVLGNKFVDWKYEREIRIISNTKGPLTYHSRAIKSIIFGLRMSDSDKRTIRNICDTEKLKHVTFKQARKKDSSFGTEVVDS